MDIGRRQQGTGFPRIAAEGGKCPGPSGRIRGTDVRFGGALMFLVGAAEARRNCGPGYRPATAFGFRRIYLFLFRKIGFAAAGWAFPIE